MNLDLTFPARPFAAIRPMAIALLVAITTTPLVHGAEGGWIPLFNGQSLQGWTIKTKPMPPARPFWSVVDGTITCNSLGSTNHDYVWLITEREFADFELELKVKAFPDSTGNSGIQVRSRFEEGVRLHGPQIDIHPPTPWRTGLIYDETRGTERWIFPSLTDWRIDEKHAPKGWRWETNGWNQLRIVCQGHRIQTWLNGIPAADLHGAGLLDDPAHQAQNVGMKGHIALQCHGRDEVHIQFKDIRVRSLPSAH